MRIRLERSRIQIFKLSSGKRPNTSSTEAIGRLPIRFIREISDWQSVCSEYLVQPVRADEWFRLFRPADFR